MKIAILGRQPEISLAELRSLYGSAVTPFGPEAALINQDSVNIDRLGGTIKLAELESTLETADWQQIRDYLTQLPRPTGDSKALLGLSTYGFKVNSKEILATGLSIKKAWGGPVRIVPANKGTVISTAQALHNRLNEAGNADWLVVTNGKQTVIGRAEQIQDIEGYTARDQARPSRSAKIGMLPPKLAQILINLASPQPGSTLLDPFCGSGVILQEALLMGLSVIGSDNSREMVEAAKQNLNWLAETHRLRSWSVELADAINHQWSVPVGAIATESYLGPAISSPLSVDQQRQIKAEINELVIAWLANLQTQVLPGTKVAFCLPAWRIKDGFSRVNILDQTVELGYTLEQFAPPDQPLIYWRPGQMVGREIIVLRRQ
ncbi:MAG TPA: DNA methyltransferase [Candidatus Nanoarchaeia archaeon]|nr:DNA methyltransferase [Candidatus Nanoarchaeia archaeon]